MAIAYRSSSQSAFDSVSSKALAAPTGMAAGDIIIAVLSFVGSPTVTPTGSGWTTVAGLSGTTTRGVAYIRTATSADVATGTFTMSFSGSSSGVFGLVAYSGNPTFDVTNGSVFTGGNVNSMPAPSVTTTVAGDVVACVYIGEYPGVVSLTSTLPGGVTSRYNASVSGTNVTGHMAVGDLVQATAAATPVETATPNGWDAGIAVQVAVMAPSPPRGRRGYKQTIKGFRGRGVLTF